MQRMGRIGRPILVASTAVAGLATAVALLVPTPTASYQAVMQPCTIGSLGCLTPPCTINPLGLRCM